MSGNITVKGTYREIYNGDHLYADLSFKAETPADEQVPAKKATPQNTPKKK